MKKLAICLLALLLMLASVSCHTEKPSDETESDGETEEVTLGPEFDGIETGLPFGENESALWKLNGGAMVVFGEGPVSAASASYYPWNEISERINRITVTEGISYVGAYAFYGLDYLVELTFESGSVSSLGMACIGDNCHLLRVDLGDSLREIPMELFVRCYDLEEVTIPVTVTRIGSFAFDKCESLKTIRYEGSEEEWNAIKIELGNAELLAAEVIFHCKDAEGTKGATE